MTQRPSYAFDFERLWERGIGCAFLTAITANVLLVNRLPEKPLTPQHAALIEESPEDKAVNAMHRLYVLARQNRDTAAALKPVFEQAMHSDPNPQVQSWAKTGFETAKDIADSAEPPAACHLA